MTRTRLERPTQAVVIAALAVLVAIGGTATAVTKIGTRSLKNRAVTAKKLRNDAVTQSKLADGAVATEHLQDGAVTGAKLGDDAVTGAEVDDGSLGVEDLAPVAVNVGFNPSSISDGSCAESGDILVPGMQGSDEILVLPGGYDEGWSADLFLDAYGASGPATIRVRVCLYSTTPTVNPPELPLRVLLFR